jgi:hypothetical protein
MKLKHSGPRCDAITTKGERCRLVVEPGQVKCKYHVGGKVTAAVHERNRQATRRFGRPSARLASARAV